MVIGSEKKPRKRVINRVLLGTGLVILGVGGLVGVEVYRALTAVPGNEVDYTALYAEAIADYQSGLPEHITGLPEPELRISAWDASVLAADRLREFETEIAEEFCPGELCFPMYHYIGNGGEERILSEDSRSVESDLEMHRIGVAVVDRFAECGIDQWLDHVARSGRTGEFLSGGPIEEMAFSSHLGRVRALSRTNVARLRMHAARDEYADFIRVTEQSLGLARMVSGCGLVGQMVSDSCATLLEQEIRDYVLWRSPPPDVCRDLIAVIERQRTVAPLSFVFDLERIIMQAAHQSQHTADGRFLVHTWREDGMALEEPFETILPDHKISNMAYLFYPKLSDVLRDYNRTMDAVVAATVLPPSEWGGEVDRRVDEAEEISVAGPGWSYKSMLLTLRGHNAKKRTLLDASLLLLAIRAFEGEVGHPPEALESLVPDYLREVPQDLFAADGAFRYRVLAEPSESGLGFELYSVGSDKRDNGGTSGSRVEAAFSSGGATFGFDDKYEGLDAVFTELRDWRAEADELGR